MFEKFTRQARRVVVDAHEESRRRVGTEHLLLALLGPDSDGGGRIGERCRGSRRCAAAIAQALGEPGCSRTGAAALLEIGMDIPGAEVQARIEESFGPGALAPSPLFVGACSGSAGTRVKPAGRRSCRTGVAGRACDCGTERTGTEHTCSVHPGGSGGPAARIMAEAGIEVALWGAPPRKACAARRGRVDDSGTRHTVCDACRWSRPARAGGLRFGPCRAATSPLRWAPTRRGRDLRGGETARAQGGERGAGGTVTDFAEATRPRAHRRKKKQTWPEMTNLGLPVPAGLR